MGDQMTIKYQNRINTIINVHQKIIIYLNKEVRFSYSFD